MTILTKACKPDSFESENSLKHSFTNTQGLLSNFVDCEYFFESNSPDTLALCGTNLDDSNDSGNFSVKYYLPFNQKDSSAHMHGLTVYMKEGLPFARDFSLENFADCSTGFTSYSVLLPFPVLIRFFVFVCDF